MRPSPYTIMMKGTDKAHKFDVRLRMAQDALEFGIKPTARKWGISRATVRTWKRRYENEGKKGLQDQRKGPKVIPHKTSQEEELYILNARKQAPCYGPRRLKDFFGAKASLGAIQRILRSHQLTRKRRKKYQKKNDLREVKAKLCSFYHFQVDLKHLRDIPNYYGQMKALDLPRYQYTGRDTKSGMLFLGYSNEISELNARHFVLSFVGEIKRYLSSKKEIVVQTDNGSEFSGGARKSTTGSFTRELKNQLGIKHVFIPPGLCNANSDVESSHQTIEEEFYDLCKFSSRKDFFIKAETYRLFYNLKRWNYSKKKRTPVEIAKEDLKEGRAPYKGALFGVIDLDRLSNVDFTPIKGGQTLPVVPETSYAEEMHR